MSKTGAERPGSLPRLSSGGEKPLGHQLSLRTRAPVLCTGCEGPSLHPEPGGQREGASEAPNVQAASPSQAWPTLARLVPSVLLASPLPLVVPPPAPIRALQVIRVLGYCGRQRGGVSQSPQTSNAMAISRSHPGMNLMPCLQLSPAEIALETSSVMMG